MKAAPSVFFGAFRLVRLEPLLIEYASLSKSIIQGAIKQVLKRRSNNYKVFCF